MGFIRQWSVIGPFDNVSRSGCEKSYAPEREIDFGKPYVGKDDQSLRWHRLGVVSRDGVCAVARALGGHGASVYYAATGVFSPKEQTVLCRFDPSGASKAWLDGRLVFSEDIVRSGLPLVADTFRVEVKLRQGWNTLVVK